MISSTTNKQVKFVNALVKKAKTRREEDLFVAEGLRMCSEIPKDRNSHPVSVRKLQQNEGRQSTPGRCEAYRTGNR